MRGSLTDHAGDWYEINEARVVPGCVQQPRLPLAAGAGGPRALRLAATYGEGWITYGDTAHQHVSAAGTAAVVRRQMARLDEHLAAFGRDPSTVDRIYLIGNTEARPLQSVEAFVDFAERYREIGFTDLVYNHPRADDPVWNEPQAMVEEITARML